MKQTVVLGNIITMDPKRPFAKATLVKDGAVNFMLDAIAEAEKATGDMDQRNIIVHLQVVTDDEVRRMADTRTMPGVAPLWTGKEPGTSGIRRWE